MLKHKIFGLILSAIRFFFYPPYTLSCRPPFWYGFTQGFWPQHEVCLRGHWGHCGLVLFVDAVHTEADAPLRSTVGSRQGAECDKTLNLDSAANCQCVLVKTSHKRGNSNPPVLNNKNHQVATPNPLTNSQLHQLL